MAMLNWTSNLYVYQIDCNAFRFLLRRAAVRAVSAQPSRQLSTLRRSTRVTSFQTTNPTLYRSFHQSQLWRAEEKKDEEASKEDSSPALAETTDQPVTEEPSAQDESIKEESIATPEVADAAQKQPTGQPDHAHDAVSESSGTTSAPLGQSEAEPQTVSEQASELADTVKETASDVSQTAQQTASSVSETVKETANDVSESAQETAANASEKPKQSMDGLLRSAQETASNTGEKAYDALTSVAEAAQNTVASAAGQTTGFERSGPERPPVQLSRILYIGNLFFEVTAPQLEAEFARFGEIKNSRVVTDNRGLSKGFGYIEMGTQEAATAALETLNQRVFQGRRMSVQYHVKKERSAENMRLRKTGTSPSKTLFIGNMSYQMSDRDLNGMVEPLVYRSSDRS